MSLGYSGNYITISGTTIKIESIDAVWYSSSEGENKIHFIINGTALNLNVSGDALDEVKVQLDQLLNSRPIV